jgi:hypothetical protein
MIAHAEKADAVPLLKGLLLDADEYLRTGAIVQLRGRLEPAELEDLLAEYTRGRYFYNVVTWLDRMLYAPGILHSYYEEELRQLIQASNG